MGRNKSVGREQCLASEERIRWCLRDTRMQEGSEFFLLI